MAERTMEEVGYGASVQALRQRGAGQEWADARQAALPVQSLRPELHGHARPWQAAGHESGCRAALRQWPLHEPHGQAPGCLDTHGPSLAGAVRGSLRAEARAGRPGRGDRTRRDVALPEKSPSHSGSGKLGIVLQGSWWTGTAAVVTEPLASGCLSESSAGA